MCFKGAGLDDTFGDKGIHISDLAIFAGSGQMGDGFLKAGPRCDKSRGQIEHLLKRGIAQNQSQISVIDRERLGNQVQTGGGHRACLRIIQLHLVPPLSSNGYHHRQGCAKARR